MHNGLKLPDALGVPDEGAAAIEHAARARHMTLNDVV